VEQVGKGATDFRLGNGIFGRVGPSRSIDLAIVSTDRINKKPEWLSFDEAAAIGTDYLTGMHMRSNGFKLREVMEGSSAPDHLFSSHRC